VGSDDPRVGNILIVAVPRASGHVFSYGMSQFSYGASPSIAGEGEQVTVDGGFDSAGNLTRDPRATKTSQRPLPSATGKAPGRSPFDMVDALLSAGCATIRLEPIPERTADLSQVFIRYQSRLSRSPTPTSPRNHAYLHEPPCSREVSYPGESVSKPRNNKILPKGIPLTPNLDAKFHAIA